MFGLGGLILASVFVFGGVQAAKAGAAGREGKAALLRSEKHLAGRDLEKARSELRSAERAFGKMADRLDGFGPLRPVARVTPFLRSHVVAAEVLQGAGTTLSQAGLRLADAAQEVMDASDRGVPLSSAVDQLRLIQSSLDDGVKSLTSAEAKVRTLEGRWLIGPVGNARDDLVRRLPRVTDRATSAEQGLGALIRFAGGAGDRRYLYLSQNPDEIRPTGGFMGTFGVVTARSDGLGLEGFQAIGEFKRRHPDVGVPGAEAGSPFRFARPPVRQYLADVNNTPDWPTAARLAMDLWQRAGEPPVDGVLSFTPAFLVRILEVLGPVEVPEYGETVTAANLIERFDYYTERAEEDLSTGVERKEFVTSLGELVVKRLIDAPSSKWERLARAVGDGFAAREGFAWATDPEVAEALADRGWDGRFPQVPGDFFYNGEFSYQAKNGRGLKRTFDHRVALRRDGSARITTTMTLANTDEAGRFNLGSLSYITLYGPEGAVLQPASDPPVSMEPAIAGHPAAGYFLSAPAGGQVTLTVVWEARNIARRAKGGTWTYSLLWLRVPDHTGDVLNLHVDLPADWQWATGPPPTSVPLTEDVRGTWKVKPS